MTSNKERLANPYISVCSLVEWRHGYSNSRINGENTFKDIEKRHWLIQDPFRRKVQDAIIIQSSAVTTRPTEQWLMISWKERETKLLVFLLSLLFVLSRCSVNHKAGSMWEVEPVNKKKSTGYWHSNVAASNLWIGTTLIARFMGPTCLPRELCYLGIDPASH